jgi:hypothetical protein
MSKNKGKAKDSKVKVKSNVKAGAMSYHSAS